MRRLLLFVVLAAGCGGDITTEAQSICSRVVPAQQCWVSNPVKDGTGVHDGVLGILVSTTTGPTCVPDPHPECR